MKNALIILAGGNSIRFNNNKNIPKQFIKIDKNNIIEYFLDNIEEKIFDIIVIVCKNKMKTKYLNNIKNDFNYLNIHFTKSGRNRQHSSKLGLIYLKKFNPKKVLIHDSARPMTSNSLMKKLINSIDKNFVSAPYIVSNDYIKHKSKKINIDQNLIKHIQTPQAFNYKLILYAHNKIKNCNAKDDTILTEKLGYITKLIKGDKINIKITKHDDLKLFNIFKNKQKKFGIGYDIHKIDYKSKKKLILCGLKINHSPLIGHSDADVGFHAICDSILGALSLRDIGYYFNNKNKKWKNVDSKVFLLFAKKKLKDNNFKIVNIDINFICETPKIHKLIKKMINNISKILSIKKDIISIKATTNEKISFIGKGEAIAAESIVSIENV
tara:strand:- start:743 stop:1888 length:1146 start_codon:yes stop_codon:yes gene_type:complete